MKKLLIATTRKEKIREIRQELKDLKLKLLTLKDVGLNNLEVQESGKTYKENAILKARFYGQKSQLLTLADDSGLEVFALPKKLGVKSKRYVLGTDEDRYFALLEEMKNIPSSKRGARFVTFLALFDPETQKIKTSFGVCRGRIAFLAKGKGGFCYDKIFIPEGFKRHMAELTLKEKNKISSRAKAVRKIKRILKKYH